MNDTFKKIRKHAVCEVDAAEWKIELHSGFPVNLGSLNRVDSLFWVFQGTRTYQHEFW